MPSDKDAKKRYYWRTKMRELGIEPDIRIKNPEQIKREYYETLREMGSHYTEPEKKKQSVDTSKALIPTPSDRHSEGADVDDFYAVLHGKIPEREKKSRLRKINKIIEDCKRCIYPHPKDLEDFTPEERRKILVHIPYQSSSLIRGRGGYLVDLDGKPLKKKEKKKSVWVF